MTLVLFQTILQTISTTLQWLGFSAGVRTSTGPSTRLLEWITGSAAVYAAWFVGIGLLASVDFFSNHLLPRRVPSAMVIVLAFGYLLPLSGHVPRQYRRHPAALADRHPDVPDYLRLAADPVFSG